MATHVLVAGWFSFSNGHTTAGDLLSRDVACEWLTAAGCSYDVALAPPFTHGVDWRSVDPESYAFIVFVCGPFQQGELESEFFAHFKQSRIIGLNLSMLLPLHVWNPFDLLIERDSSTGAHPDMVFAARQPLVPVVGVCLVEAYDEGRTDEANAAIDRLLASREMAVVPIDTRLDIANSAGLRTPAEIESLLARVDVVVTTRLHGAVLALKNGVPVVAIDPETGGAKIRRQMATIGWPVAFNVDTLTDEGLQQALAYCLTPEARSRAQACAAGALTTIAGMRAELIAALNDAERWTLSPARQQERDAARTLPLPSDEPATEVLPPPAPQTPVRQAVRRAKRLLRRVIRRGAFSA